MVVPIRLANNTWPGLFRGAATRIERPGSADSVFSSVATVVPFIAHRASIYPEGERYGVFERLVAGKAPSMPVPGWTRPAVAVSERFWLVAFGAPPRPARKPELQRHSRLLARAPVTN